VQIVRLQAQVSHFLEDDKEQVQNKSAESFGLTAEELNQAIKRMGRNLKARDIFEKGVFELYQGNYAKASELLAVSAPNDDEDIQAQTARLQVQLNKLADITSTKVRHFIVKANTTPQ